jgi:hypothetical protein
MDRKALVTGGGLLLFGTGGAVLVGGVPRLMALFGVVDLPAASAGDPAWVGVAFARVFAAALVALGVVALGARRLTGQAARAVAFPLAGGLALLTLLTVIQAQAIWDTRTSWALAAVMAVACVSVAGWGLAERVTAE